MINLRRTGSIILILVFWFVLIGEASLVSGAQGGLEVHEVLTCEEYDPERHIPNGVTDYYELSDPGVTLWVNMTKTGDANITILWFSPTRSLAHREAGSEVFESAYWQEIVSVLPLGGVDASGLGVWSVELWVDGASLANYTFNMIDKASGSWGLHAEIVGVESPRSVNPDTNFTASITVLYRFRSMTAMTPGLWSPDDESLIVEDYDEVEGEGTKTYSFTVQSPSNPGEYTIDAAVFYLYDDEWFIDEGGLASFQVTVESGGGWFTMGNAFVAATIVLTAAVVLILWKRR